MLHCGSWWQLQPRFGHCPCLPAPSPVILKTNSSHTLCHPCLHKIPPSSNPPTCTHATQELGLALARLHCGHICRSTMNSTTKDCKGAQVKVG